MQYIIKDELQVVVTQSSIVSLFSDYVQSIFKGMISDGVVSKVMRGKTFIILHNNSSAVWNALPRFPRYQVSDCGLKVRNKITLRELKPNRHQQVKLLDENGEYVWVVTSHLLSEI